MKPLVGPGSSSDYGNPMLQEHARHEISKLEVEQPYDTCELVGLEAKELGEQVTDGPGIYLASG